MIITWTVNIAYTPTSCQYIVTTHSLVLVLPVYGLLYITVVRTIFLKRPFDNDLILKTRYQLCGLFIGLCICGSVFCLPHLGVCGIDLVEPGSGTTEPYCSYSCESVEYTIFTTSAVLVGYILPVVVVVVLYALIYSTVLISRQRTRKLTNSMMVSESEKSEGESSGKKSKLVTKIRNSVPWCIIIILFLYVISTVPWIPMDLWAPKVVQLLENRSYSSLMIDIMYSLLFIGSGLSPLTYLVSSNTLRGLLFIEYKKLIGLFSKDSSF